MFDSKILIIYAYLITNIANGKQYVGVTSKSISVRWKQHCYYARKKPLWPLHRAIAKYGPENFSIAEVSQAFSIAEAARLERALISTIGSLLPNGYNQSVGGEFHQNGVAGSKYSLETRKKISNGVKIAYKEGRGHLKLSDETKKKIAEGVSRTCGAAEYRKAASARYKELFKDPVIRKNISDGVKKQHLANKDTEKYREREIRRKLAASERLKDPDVRAKIKARLADPEVKARMSYAAKNRGKNKATQLIEAADTSVSN